MPSGNTAPRFVGVFPVNARGEILLQLRDNRPELYGPGTWSTLGGSLEPDEEPEVCALRELEEETGRRPERLLHLATVRRVRPDRPLTYTFSIYGVAVAWTPDELLLAEGQGLAWIPAERVASLPLNELIVRDIRAFAASAWVRSLAASAPPWPHRRQPELPADLPARLGIGPFSLVALDGATAAFAERLRPLLPDGAHQTATPGATDHPDVILWWPRPEVTDARAEYWAAILRERGHLWLCGGDDAGAREALAAAGLTATGVTLALPGGVRAAAFAPRPDGTRERGAGLTAG